MRSEPQGFFDVGGTKRDGGWLYDDNNVDDNNCSDHDDNNCNDHDDDDDVDGDDDGDDDNEPTQLTRNEREATYFWEQFGR